VFLVFSLHLGDQGSVNSASMYPMTLAMSNEPIAFIVSTTSLKGNVMADIPLLAWNYFHTA
jgi:hypothetical protein